MHVLPVAIFVLAAVVLAVVAYFYSVHVSNYVAEVERDKAEQAHKALYACLNAELDGAWVRFPVRVDIAYFDGSKWVRTVDDRAPIRHAPIYVGSVCYVVLEGTELRAYVYG